MKLSVSAINNSTTLQKLLALSTLSGSGSTSGTSQLDLTSLLGGGDTSDISAEGSLLSSLGDLPSGVQDKIGALQSDLSSVDPTNLSDDDVKSFLTKLKTDLGSLPGALSTYDPDNMSGADVKNARDAIANMKSLTDELGQTGSMISYTGMSSAQTANYIAMLQQAGDLGGSSSSAGMLNLLTSYNPNDQSSSADSTSGIYKLLSSYDQVSMGNLPNVSLADIMNSYEENAGNTDATQNNVDYSA